MKIIEYEKLLLGMVLGNVNLDKKFRVISELKTDRFSTPEHRKIYQAVSKLVRNNETVDPSSVALELGGDLEKSGGMEYLVSLVSFPNVCGLSDYDSYEQWMRAVDNAGRVRLLGMLFKKHENQFSDIDNFISKVSDVDEFLTNFMHEANRGISSVRTNYKPIAEAVDIAKRKIYEAQEGFITDIIVCGLPSLEPYFIPRPASFGVICGIESMGKTQLGLEIGLGVAKNLYANNLNGQVALNVLETTDYRIAIRLACIEAQVSTVDLMGGTLTQEKFISVNEELTKISQLPIVYNDDPTITSDEFVWHAIAHNLTKGRVYALADYLELFKDKRDQSEELRVSNIARNIKSVCNICGSCETAISQFNKTVFSSSSKIGGTHAARASGAIAHAAEWWIEVWNAVQMERRKISFTVPEGMREDMAYLFILKNKEYMVGEVEMEWIPEHMTFRDPMLPDNQIFKVVRAAQF